MKKFRSIFLLFPILFTMSAFCDVESDKNINTYARLGVSALPTGNTYSVAPSFTAGKRAIIDVHGVDISVGFSGVYQENDHFSQESTSFSEGYNDKNYSFFYTAPKVTYLRFFEPVSHNKLYAGLGGALGGSHLHHLGFRDNRHIYHTSKFFGLMGNALIGYNFESKAISAFMQFDYSQPLIPIYKSHNVNDNPIYEMSFGLGF